MASGIPEVKAFLNGTSFSLYFIPLGTNIPGVFKYTTFLAKAFGTVLSVSAGLAVGKEGPMVCTTAPDHSIGPNWKLHCSHTLSSSRTPQLIQSPLLEDV